MGTTSDATHLYEKRGPLAEGPLRAAACVGQGAEEKGQLGKDLQRRREGLPRMRHRAVRIDHAAGLAHAHLHAHLYCARAEGCKPCNDEALEPERKHEEEGRQDDDVPNEVLRA
jgi:hypothetical protein